MKDDDEEQFNVPPPDDVASIHSSDDGRIQREMDALPAQSQSQPPDVADTPATTNFCGHWTAYSGGSFFDITETDGGRDLNWVDLDTPEQETYLLVPPQDSPVSPDHGLILP